MSPHITKAHTSSTTNGTYVSCVMTILFNRPEFFIYINISECEGGIEKSIPRITDWHCKACRVMTNSDPERWIILSHPHKENSVPSITKWHHEVCWEMTNRDPEGQIILCHPHIENSVLRITYWHYKACRVMTNGDPERQIILSHPHIEKSVPRITDWHHKACQVMTNGDPEGWIYYIILIHFGLLLNYPRIL